MTLTAECYRFTRGLPKEEMYGLTSQIRRSSASIAADIAEGYGRELNRSFIQFLRVAQGSLKELETHLLIAEKVELASNAAVSDLLNRCESLGKKLRRLIEVRRTRELEI